MNKDTLKAALKCIDQRLEVETAPGGGTVGCVVAISHKNKIVYKRAFGYANLETKEEMTTGHLFRIASQSKTCTAIAILQLVEQGKLTLDDCAYTYLPFLAKNPDKRVRSITIRMLLQHNSGLWRDGEVSNFWNVARPFPTKEELTHFLKTYPLTHDCGTKFQYSNYGYALLGLILEEVSGLDYSTYVQQNILEPLDLKPENIGPNYVKTTKPYAVGYIGPTPITGKIVPLSPTLNTKALTPATGFYADAESVIKIYEALIPGNKTPILTEASKKELQTPHITPIGEEKTSYGFGISIENWDDTTVFGHTGEMPGVGTSTLCDPDEHITITILCTGKRFSQQGFWRTLKKFKEEYTPKSPFLKYQGVFYDIWGAIHLVPLGEKVYVTGPKSTNPYKDWYHLKHQEGQTFKTLNGFAYDKNKEPIKMIVENNTLIAVDFSGNIMHKADVYEKHLKKIAYSEKP